ncbi:MAG TPA: hypothetical protein VMS98_03475 [Thermoanaerobaculia bacterium]|nr:hypothetical protein [Thermoanaerobaculia bacterium]
MPEQISKYPEVTIAVLKGAGGRCGEGVEQKILTACPPERFCSMPTGEICVYGLAEIPKMTQIKTADLQPIVHPPAERSFGGTEAAALGATLVVGFIVGRLAGSVARPG